MQQAKDYEDLIKDSGFNKLLQFLANMNGTHPFNSVRCSEIHKWCQSNEFNRIINGEINIYKEEPASEEQYCKRCGAKLGKDALYCPRCGYKQ